MNPNETDVASKKFQEGDIREAVMRAIENLPDRLAETPYAGMRGKGVTIAIIDTWPGTGAIRATAARLPDEAKKRLLRVIDGDPDPASEERAIQVTEILGGSNVSELCMYRHQGADDTVLNRNFKDHGLFIAGIIREIAPKATIRVYHTFNDVGASTTDLVALAVNRAKVDARRDRTPLVLNCSFYLSSETHGIEDLINGDWELAYDDGMAWQRQVFERAPRIRQGNVPRSWVLKTRGAEDGKRRGHENRGKNILNNSYELRVHQAVFGSLSKRDVLPVAAVGNDSRRTGSEDEDYVMWPRVPALLEHVLGVSSALPIPDQDGDWRPADYSNNDDWEKRRNDGVSAMGGTNARNEQSHPAYLLGPYISEDLQPNNDNKLGHALWSGTSFATPIVSALAAFVWSEVRKAEEEAGGPVNGRPVTGDDIMDGIVGTKANPNAKEWVPGDKTRLIPLIQRIP